MELTRANPDLDAVASIPAMIRRQAKFCGAETIFRKKVRGIWKSTTWAELDAAVRRVGMALKSIGFVPGDVACIIAENSPAWATCDLGILGAGGVSVGIYTTDGAEQVKSLLRDCRARVVFAGDEEQLDKILQVRADCPAIERIITFGTRDLRGFNDPMCESLKEFQARGGIHDAVHPKDWNSSIAGIRPTNCAVLTYTAGMTGLPKGVALSHRAILCQVSKMAALSRQEGAERLAFLPMAHVMERVLGLYQSLYSGMISNYVEKAETVRENLREVTPTFLCAPPFVWEKLRSRTMLAIHDATRLQRSLCRWALGAQERVIDAQMHGRQTSLFYRLATAAGSLLVLRPIRRAMGLDRVRTGWIGGAPVSPSLVRWYGALGIDLVEFYGLAESAGFAFAMQPERNGKRAIELPASPGEVKFSEAGEILLRGNHVFSGYWRDGVQARPQCEAGWFRTGDLAKMENGAWRVTGRVEDTITMKTGHGVDPSCVELELKFSPYIADAIVVGDRRDFLGCLVMIDQENLERWARDRKIAFTAFAGLTRSDAVRDLIAGEIERVNAKLAEPVRSFRLIDRRLELEDPELTPLMKLRRGLVSEKFRHLIDEMYCDV